MADADSLAALISADARRLLAASGSEFVRQVGWDVVRGVVGDVMAGHNLRTSTEPLTRRRIAHLNLALVEMFVRGGAANPTFSADLVTRAADILARPRVPKADKRLAQWVLGLNDKAVQNVLRDDGTAINTYRSGYVETCDGVIASYTASAGPLDGSWELGPDIRAGIDWRTALYLANAISSQTLGTRGSEKSVYGKLFEKLVLGSLLTLLGFRRVAAPAEAGDNVFWLSSAGAKRESDATLLVTAGQGVRFDIGFIGRGNTEISLDKVSRFERETEHGRAVWALATLIIVDRIGRKSRIVELAKAINGTIIQMSSSVWPTQVAQVLRQVISGYDHPLAHMGPVDALDYVRRELAAVPLEPFLTRHVTKPRLRKKKSD